MQIDIKGEHIIRETKADGAMGLCKWEHVFHEHIRPEQIHVIIILKTRRPTSKQPSVLSSLSLLEP